MSESFAELFEQSMASTVMRPSALTVAEVVSIEGDYVTLSAGLKSEAEVPVSEFTNTEGTLDINVGDKVEVTVESVDDGFGQTRLSREKARRERAWEDMETAAREDKIVHGVLTGKVKGGFTVSIEGVRAFCLALWSMYGRLRIPVFSKARTWNSRSSNSIGHVIMWLSHGAPWLRKNCQWNENHCWNPCKRVR